MAVSGKLRTLQGGLVAFMCPGCDTLHQVRHQADGGKPCWTWDGSFDAPTFSPSVLVRWPDPDNPGKNVAVCHSFVRAGRIQFLADCTHALAGQTVDLPDMK